MMNYCYLTKCKSDALIGEIHEPIVTSTHECMLQIKHCIALPSPLVGCVGNRGPWWDSMKGQHVAVFCLHLVIFVAIPPIFQEVWG